MGVSFEGVSWAHPCGTDMLGTDVCMQLVMGTQVALLRGFCAAVCVVCLGVVVGLLLFFLPRVFQEGLRVCVDVFLVWPSVVMLMVWCAVWPVQSHRDVCLRTACVMWGKIALAVHALVKETMACGYVKASLSMGAGVWHVCVWHVWSVLRERLCVWWLWACVGHVAWDHMLQWMGYVPQPLCTGWGVVLKSVSYAPSMHGMALCAVLWMSGVLYGVYVVLKKMVNVEEGVF